MMKTIRTLLFVFALGCAAGSAGASIHVWEKQELTFTAEGDYANPYTDVVVWVDLTGPGFNKRVYGFWDGGKTFHLRLLATAPGNWTWKSGSMPVDTGLNGKTGSFDAVPWTDAEKNENPLRRGMLQPTPNRHALQFADGTPYFALGDTWFALAADRFHWRDGDAEHPIGPEASFQDYVRFRKKQGFNWINVIASFPNWNNDGRPFRLNMDNEEKTPIRFAWREFGTDSAKNMDNEGGKPFAFPGRVPGYENIFPDVDRINPEYFKYLDRKIDYLNAQGFVAFIEAARRDVSICWAKYYGWPESYARYVQYVWSRYQANSTVLAPVHLDILKETVSPAEYTAAMDYIRTKYGLPPFGTLLSSNANPSTLENWGEDSWVTLHQTGNKREHDYYWYLTEIFNLTNPQPALNGEPYYAGYKDVRGLGGGGYKYGAKGGTERDDLYCRSGMYGSFLSGGLAGHIYGAEGIWGSDIEPDAPTKMWDAFLWKSAAQMQHLRTFAFSVGRRYQDLIPTPDLVSPNKNYDTHAYEGWAYCARTKDREVYLAYFEKDSPARTIRGAKPNSRYRAQWFDPRNGTWSDVGNGRLTTSEVGTIALPPLPGARALSVLPLNWIPGRWQHRVDPTSDEDWGLRLVFEGPADSSMPPPAG